MPPRDVGTSKSPGSNVLVRVPFAVPERGGLPPLENYARLRSNGDLRLSGYTETTRGCKYRCGHCPVTPIYNGRFFVVPHDVVMEDIRIQVNQGAQHITFGDPDFLNGPSHARRIVRALHTEFPELSFDFTARVQHLLRHANLLTELAACGCAFVVSAIESLSDNVLEALEKGHSSADVAAVVRLMDRVGIPLRPSLLAFTPWTTLDDYLEMLAFVRDNDLVDHIDPVHYGIRLLIPPGSALLTRYENAPWLGELDVVNYTYTWRHPDPRMDKLHLRVAAVAEHAERNGRDARQSFAAIEEAACLVACAALPMPRIVPQRRPIPAGLTENWFC
jgi:hypothetical protein